MITYTISARIFLFFFGGSDIHLFFGGCLVGVHLAGVELSAGKGSGNLPVGLSSTKCCEMNITENNY